MIATIFHTKTIQNEEYLNVLFEVLNEIEKLLSLKNIAYSLNRKPFITERITTYLRHVQDPNNNLKKLIQSQILEAVYKCEKASGQSADLMLFIFLFSIKKIINDGFDPNDLNEIYKESIDILEKNRKKPYWSDIVECVRKFSNNKKISKMVLEAINLAGLEGTILPYYISSGVYNVELVSGFDFPVSTYPIFTDNDKWERFDVKAIVVDGAIEKESEIDHIFAISAKLKKPLLIVARGYGEDVIGTIAKNSTLDICPIRIPFEVESINLLTDISIVCGGHIITPLKGDLISTIKYNELPIVEHVICSKNNLKITNNKTNKEVSNHLKSLIKKRDEQKADELFDAINQRIKSLVSHTVHLRIGSTNEQEKLKELESIDYSLRMVRSILAKGIVVPANLDKTFIKINEKRPTNSVLYAIHYGFSLAKMLGRIEKVVLVDD